MSVSLQVPDDFELPQFYQGASREVVANILMAGPFVVDGAMCAANNQARGAVEELQRQMDELRRERSEMARAAGERAAELAAPLVQQVRTACDAECAGLRAQLADSRERALAAEKSARDLAALQVEVKDLGCALRGSNTLKGVVGENQVLHQVAVLCPDSQVEPRSREDHCGDGLWTRHFGSSHLSMRCMLEVKNVDRLRAEDFNKFYADIETQSKIGKVNSAILVSLRPATLPINNSRVRYNAYFSLDWRGSIPVIMVSNISSNPDLLGIALATMQHVWQFGERVGALGASGGNIDDESKVQSLVLLVNNFVNEQFALHSQEIENIEKSSKYLAELVRDNERRARLAQAQVENISTRLSEALGDWVQLRETGIEKEGKKRRRVGVMVKREAMTASQKNVVDACLEWQAKNKAVVKSSVINSGNVPGVTKHQVDSLFGNFSSLRMTLQAEASDGADSK